MTMSGLTDDFTRKVRELAVALAEFNEAFDRAEEEMDAWKNRIDELPAIEPGGPELERERHRDFVVDRIDLRRENFRPSPQLRDHIEALRTKHPLPHWAALPRTTTITRSHQETE